MPCPSLKLIPSSKGLAYLASATFISRLFLFSDKLLNSFFTYELIHIYSAHLETGVLLFFQGAFMIPLGLLGLLVFFGVERRSFNLVLYPSLMLLFLILLRYGAEAALLFIHWEEHVIDRGPSLLLSSLLDLFSVFVLLSHVYLDLALPDPKDPEEFSRSRLNSLRRRLQRHRQRTLDFDLDQVSIDMEDRRYNINGVRNPVPVQSQNQARDLPRIVGETKKRKPPAPPPEGVGPDLVEEITIEPPPRPPPSPKFQYRFRRNISSLKGEDEIQEVTKLDDERKRNSSSPLPATFVVREVGLRDEVQDFLASSPLKEKSQSLKLYEVEPMRLELKLEETDLDKENEKREIEGHDYWQDQEDGYADENDAEQAETQENEEHEEVAQEPEKAEEKHEAEPEPEPEPEVEAEVTVTLPKPRLKPKESFRQTAV